MCSNASRSYGEARGVIVGVGIDVVDVERFALTIDRTPALLDRLFTRES